MKISGITSINAQKAAGNGFGLKNSQKHSATFRANLKGSEGVIDSCLKNKTLQKVFEFANLSPFGFTVLSMATTCIVMRPPVILAMPGAKKEDKQYMAGKSIIASLLANSSRIAFCLPLMLAIKNLGQKARIAKNPEKIGFPAIETPKFDALNFAINSVFALALGVVTSFAMVGVVAKAMDKFTKWQNKKELKKHSQEVKPHEN